MQICIFLCCIFLSLFQSKRGPPGRIERRIKRTIKEQYVSGHVSWNIKIYTSVWEGSVWEETCAWFWTITFKQQQQSYAWYSKSSVWHTLYSCHWFVCLLTDHSLVVYKQDSSQVCVKCLPCHASSWTSFSLINTTVVVVLFQLRNSSFSFWVDI